MPLTERVREILSWYPSDNPGTKANLARMLMTGTLGGTRASSMVHNVRLHPILPGMTRNTM
jgi:hypothetical protein